MEKVVALARVIVPVPLGAIEMDWLLAVVRVSVEELLPVIVSFEITRFFTLTEPPLPALRFSWPVPCERMLRFWLVSERSVRVAPATPVIVPLVKTVSQTITCVPSKERLPDP